MVQHISGHRPAPYPDWIFFSIFYAWQSYDNSDKSINFVTPKVGKAAETPQKLVGKAAEIPQKLVGKAAEMTKETNNMTHLYD